MAMRVTEKRILNNHAGPGTVVVEIVTAVLLNVFAWLTYFSFVNIDLFHPPAGAASSATLTLLCIVLVSLVAALLSRIPKYGERQLYIWLVPELALFLITVAQNPQGGNNELIAWWKALFIKPPRDVTQLMPFESGLAVTLMFLAVLLLTSAIIADDLCVHRRGTPLLLTVIPIFLFILSEKRYLPKDKNLYLYRWYFGIYLALLVFAMIFSIGKERPRKFWKKRFNMGATIFLIMAIILSSLLGVYQNKDPNVAKQMQNRTTKSSMTRKAKKEMEKSGLPMGDIRNATMQATQTSVYFKVKPSRNLTQPLYFRCYTGDIYNGKWKPLSSKSVSPEVKNTLIPSLMTGQLSNGKPYASLTFYSYEKQISKNGKNTASQKKMKDNPTKLPYILVSYETLYDKQFTDVTGISRPSSRTFNTDNFKPENNSDKSYSINIAMVNTSSFAGPAKLDKKYAGAEAEYSKLAKESYGKISGRDEKAVLNQLKSMGWNPSAKSLDAAREEVQSFLSRNFNTIDIPLKPDKNEDPLIYALTKEPNTKTHKRDITQVYMASLETILLRSEGIPARYVEGYQLDPQGAKKDSKGAYTLNHKNLHAWCEVYVSHKGWLPMELGSGKSSGSKNEPKRIRRGQNGKQKTRIQQKNAGRKVRKSHKHSVWMILLYIVLAAIIITALVFAAIALRRKQMLKKLAEGDRPENTFLGYRILMKNLRRKHYPASAQHPDWLLPYLGEQYHQYLNCVYKERYSETGLNAQERQFCKEFVLNTIEDTQRLSKEEQK